MGGIYLLIIIVGIIIIFKVLLGHQRDNLLGSMYVHILLISNPLGY